MRNYFTIGILLYILLLIIFFKYVSIEWEHIHYAAVTFAFII